MSLTFDGHDLETIGACGDPEITILRSVVDYADAKNRDGAIVIGRVYGTSSVAFTIEVTGSALERRNAFSTLGAWLDVDEPKQLVLPDTPDRYYMAIPEGEMKLTRGHGGETAQLTFVLADPIAYGEQKTVTVPSGGSVTFTVGGTAASKPRIQATGVRDSTSLVYGLRLDDGDFIHVATGNASGRVIVVDCDERWVTLSGNATAMTLDSDWLEFSPGSHTLVMDEGTGAATVTYRERWY